MLPKGWVQITLDALSRDEKNSFVIGPFGSDLVQSDYRSTGVPVVFVRDVKRNYFKWVSHVYVTQEKAEKLKAHSVKPSDVVITKMGLPPGLASVYPENLSPGVITADIIRLRPNKNIVDSQFLCEMLNSFFVSKQVYERTGGQTRPKLTLSDYKTICINLPPLPEQQKIAKILSTWDTAIRLTETLVEKKKAQKKWLMGQLLTGKKRLRGFGQEWQFFTLEKLAEISSGGTPKSSTSQYYGGEIPWVSIADMTKSGKWILKTETSLTKEGLQNSSARIYPRHTILYAMYASIGECSIADVELASSQAILGIRPKKSLHYLYLYYFLTSLKEKIKLQGQQGTQSNLNAGMVKKFRLKLPTIEEQKVIASVLSTLDKEIDTFRQKLNYLKQEKQALMQKLLTGKWRVNV